MEPAQKRPRLQGGGGEVNTAWDWMAFFQIIPKDMGMSQGDSITAALLRLLGSQMLAVCCRAALDWCTVNGRRVLLKMNEECRGPTGAFAPLARIHAAHVETLCLGRYGRKTPEDFADVFATCCNARMLRCVYSKLTGIASRLRERAPVLRFKRAKLHQCRFEPGDFAQLLRCCPELEVIDVYGERLSGLTELIDAEPLRCGQLQSLELNDCGLEAKDVAALLKCVGPELRSLHIQASDLQGLRVAAPLPKLQTLRLHDCQLQREDALDLAGKCPELQSLSLCGNPLGAFGGCGPTWPLMPKLMKADFRNCEFDSGDERDIRERLRGCPVLEFRVRNDGPSLQHIVFEDSSDEE